MRVTKTSEHYAGPRLQGKDRRFRAAPGLGWSQPSVARTPAELRFPVVEWPEKPSACVWPLWNDDTPRSETRRFCGDTRAPGRTYCAVHYARAYREKEPPKGGYDVRPVRAP